MNLVSHATANTNPSTSRRQRRLGAHLFGPLAIAALAGLACASTGETAGAGRQMRLLAAGNTASDVSGMDVVDRPAPATRTGRVPEEVLRDPTERLMLLERMRVQILQKTRRLPQATYEQQIRPRLQRRLSNMGLDALEVDWILEEVDRSRA